MQKIHDADIQIVEDIAQFPWTGQFDHRDIHKQIYNETQGIHTDNLHPHMPHPQFNGTHTLMGVADFEINDFSTVEATLMGVVILVIMVCAAHLFNKRQSKAKTIEFEVNDLEMP